MKLSTKGRYAARAMMDVAMHHHETPVLLPDVAERQQISMYYLENIFVRLRTAGLVKSIRGAQGGFTLAKPPSEIQLSEIVKVLEGPMAPVGCVDDPAVCERASFCAVRDTWVEMGTNKSSNFLACFPHCSFCFLPKVMEARRITKSLGKIKGHRF